MEKGFVCPAWLTFTKNGIETGYLMIQGVQPDKVIMLMFADPQKVQFAMQINMDQLVLIKKLIEKSIDLLTIEFSNRYPPNTAEIEIPIEHRLILN